MAHFAKLDENNIVTEVLVFDNSICDDLPFPESEQVALPRIVVFEPGVWKQTSYNNNFRKQYAGIGYFYDEVNDVFISIQPYPSWTLNEDFDWIPPVPRPWDWRDYNWDEENQTWNLAN